MAEFVQVYNDKAKLWKKVDRKTGAVFGSQAEQYPGVPVYREGQVEAEMQERRPVRQARMTDPLEEFR